MISPVSSDFTLGILGGGQLGKMILQPASRLDIRVAVLDPSEDSPCAGLANLFSKGDLMDFDTVLNFGRKVDVLTLEIEHVNVAALEKLEAEGKKVFPGSAVMKIIQSKIAQKKFYTEHEIPTAPVIYFNGLSELKKMNLSFPCVYKTETLGYDGKGVEILNSVSDIEKLKDVPGLIEEMVLDMIEISVIVARSSKGEIKTFPAVEMDFHPEANLVEFLFSPADLLPGIEERSAEIAENLALRLGLVGVMAVEMFVTKSGTILVNECAPRPHNSGHHTIESAWTSQYEQHLRAILGMPLGSTAMRCAAVMVNVLGEPGHEGPVHYQGLDEILKLEGVYIHIYGKKIVKPFRKMGHVTVLGTNLAEAKEKAIFVKQHLRATT